MRKDHQDPLYTMTCKHLSLRFLRWSFVQQDYSFHGEHQAAHGNADTMSCLSRVLARPPQKLLSYMAGPDTSGDGKNVAPATAAFPISDGTLLGEVPASPDVCTKALCTVCGSGVEELGETMHYDGCDHSFHTQCLDPPFTTIPPGHCHCGLCLAWELDLKLLHHL